MQPYSRCAANAAAPRFLASPRVGCLCRSPNDTHRSPFGLPIAVAAAAGLRRRLVLGYADAGVNRRLDVDGRHEVAVALCPIGRTEGSAPPAPEVSPLNLPTRAVSSREVEFPMIRTMHGASAFATGEEAAARRAVPLQRTSRDPQGELVPLHRGLR
jgi:MYXO-CTERM domain-containing protein